MLRLELPDKKKTTMAQDSSHTKHGHSIYNNLPYKIVRVQCVEEKEYEVCFASPTEIGLKDTSLKFRVTSRVDLITAN
jgi:hypothetical protein